MSNVITTRISDEVLSMIDRLAKSRDRSRSWVVAKLVASAAEKQLEMDEFIQAGIDDLDAGRTIAHEELFETIRQRQLTRAAA